MKKGKLDPCKHRLGSGVITRRCEQLSRFHRETKTESLDDDTMIRGFRGGSVPAERLLPADDNKLSLSRWRAAVSLSLSLCYLNCRTLSTPRGPGDSQRQTSGNEYINNATHFT